MAYTKNRQMHLFDARGKVLGRFAVEVSRTLSGRSRVDWVPHQDLGDSVVVVNAEKIVVTGRKQLGKVYHHFSGYPGGLSSRTFEEAMAKDPLAVIRAAIFGMLPKNRLRNSMLRRLHILVGSEHQFRIDKAHE